MFLNIVIFTSQPTHSVGASIVLLSVVCRHRLLSVIVVCRRL